MRNRNLIPVATAVAVAVVAVLSAAPASAAATHPVVAKSRLVLTVARGEKSLPANRHATLTCGPAGGSHRSARKACAAIGAVNGSLDKLVPAQTMCTMQYDPVTVTATGSWRGSALRYTHTFSNSCVLGADTGPVFAF
jgi:hypothetical protein